MALGRQIMLFAITTAITATTATGCAASDRVPGCVAPPNEAAVLDELAKDPTLAVSPPGSTRRSEPDRQTACRKVGKAMSRTAVTVQYDLARNLRADDVRRIYEPVATADGWKPLPGRPNAQPGMLLYCRDILDQPSLLIITWQDAITVEADRGSRRVPGVLTVTVSGSADNGMANLEADRAAAGCRT
jgi:hypothetical protein